MNLLAILLVFLLNIQSNNERSEIERMFCLRNNFWGDEQKQLEKEGLYLGKVRTYVESENVLVNWYDCIFKSCHLLRYTKSRYIALDDLMNEKIIKFLKNPETDEFLLRVLYLNTNKPAYNIDTFEKYKGIVKVLSTYSLPDFESIKKSEETLGNSISFKCDVSTYTRKKYIMRMLKDLINLKLLNFHDIMENLNEIRQEKGSRSKVEDDANFHCYYFDNPSKCFESLEKFIEDLLNFKLTNKKVSTTSYDESFDEDYDIEKIFDEKYNEKLKEFSEIMADEDLIALLDKNFDKFKNKILENSIFCLEGDKNNSFYYAERLSNLIFESLRQFQEKYNSLASGFKNYLLSKLTDLLNLGWRKLISDTMKDLYETNFVSEHFLKLLKRKETEIDEDCYIEFEKIMCDYYNMFVYIHNLYTNLSNTPNLLHFELHPVSTHRNDLTIIDTIRIKILKNCRFIKLIGFDEDHKRVALKKGCDFFFDDFGMLNCPSDVLIKRNIQEVEIILKDSKTDRNYNEKYKVKDLSKIT